MLGIFVLFVICVLFFVMGVAVADGVEGNEVIFVGIVAGLLMAIIVFFYNFSIILKGV